MLAIVAGMGALPSRVVNALDTPPLITNVAGYAPEGLSPEFEFSLERIASFFTALKDRDVTEVCFVGAVRRPGFNPDKVEPDSYPFVARIVEAAQKGDDGALKALLAMFEEAGFAICGAHEIAPDLLLEPGSKTTRSPDRDDDEEVRRAVTILNQTGAADIGQACVIHRGQAIALETAFGTDWMLTSLQNRPDGTGGVLYKAPKPDQEMRIDMPTIGPDTIRLAAKAGLDGVAIKAGGVMVLDPDEVMRMADELGLYFWVRLS